MKPKNLLLKFLIMLGIGILFSLVSFLLSLLIGKTLIPKANIFDIMSGIGILTIVLGAFSLIDDNPTGTGFNIPGITGGQGNQYTSKFNTEITAEERKMTGYFKNFKRQGIVSFKWGSLCTIYGGVVTLIISMIFI